MFRSKPPLPWRLAETERMSFDAIILGRTREGEGVVRSGGLLRNFGNMEDNYLAYIGERVVGGAPFGIGKSARRQHLYTVGKTGTGKSTLLRNLFLQDVHAGEGVALIDPHGDLASEVLNYIPSWRTEDVLYFNPGDQEFPVGFNLLQNVPRLDRPLVASGIVAAFKSIWRDSWGPRLEYVLYAAIAALLDHEAATLLGVQRMLVDDGYRRGIVSQVRDPMVRSFWVDEFEGYDARFRREVIAPIQNKVGQLLMAAPIRNVLGQVKRRFDPRYMMDHGKILIADLSKGKLGADKCNLLGALVVTAFQQAAMSRVNVAEEQRRDFHMLVDEFSSFTTDSFANMLSEVRKYGLSLVLSHQFTFQLNEEVRGAVFGNVGSMIIFRVGGQDARIVDEEFDREFGPQRFTGMSNFEACVRLHSVDELAVPFVGRMNPPLGTRYGRTAKIVRRSRERYAKPREVVEERIHRWMGGGGPIARSPKV